MYDNKPQRKKEKGQGMIEFSVSLVLVLTLVVGIVDLGRAIFTFMALRDGAQEGALYGSINPTQTETIKERVFGSSSYLADLESAVSVNVNTIGSPCMGNGIEVQVTYSQFPLTMPFLGAILGSQTVDISASATDTILSPACD